MKRLLLTLALAGLVGCGKSNSPIAPDTDAIPVANPSDLIHAYKANEAAADQKYLGKVVVLTLGPLGDSLAIEKEGSGYVLRQSVIMKSSMGPWSEPEILCHAAPSENAKLAAAAPKSRFKVQGKVSEKIPTPSTHHKISIVLKDCRLLEVVPQP